MHIKQLKKIKVLDRNKYTKTGKEMKMEMEIRLGN